MSDACHICGPVKHELPTVICAPCALKGHLPHDSNLPACDRCGKLIVFSGREVADHENGDGLCAPCTNECVRDMREMFG